MQTVSWWRPIRRWRLFKIRHLLGSWWLDHWRLRRDGYDPGLSPCCRQPWFSIEDDELTLVEFVPYEGDSDLDA